MLHETIIVEIEHCHSHIVMHWDIKGTNQCRNSKGGLFWLSKFWYLRTDTFYE